MKLIILPLLSFCLCFYAHGKEEDDFKICLAGTTVKTIPKYGEAFENGAFLALDKYASLKERVIIEKIYYENTAFGALEAYKKAIEINCDSIIGFSTGNDLAVIREEAKKTPILTISIYGDPIFQRDKDESIFTMQTPPKTLLNDLIQKAPIELKADKKVLVVTAVDRIEMVQYREELKKILANPLRNVVYASVVEQTHMMNEVFEKNLLRKKWDMVFLFTRSLISAELTDSFLYKKDIVFLGTKYFGSAQLPAYYNFLKDKNIHAYFARRSSALDKTKSKKDFIKDYKEKFEIEPMMISFDCYDIVTFLLKKIEKMSVVNRKTVLKNILENEEIFQGVGGVVIGPSLSMSTLKTYVLKLTPKGYELVK